MGRFAGLLLCAVFALPVQAADAWDVLRRSGGVVMLRHMQTDPGLGDPPGFRLDDCATQRNLSIEGRAAAQRLGAAFARAGVKPARVLASAWCRCRDTARIAFGAYEPSPALNSFFGERDRETAQTAALRQLIASRKAGETLVLVTHQVNITALTGVFPAMGEAVVLTGSPDGVLREIARIAPP